MKRKGQRRRIRMMRKGKGKLKDAKTGDIEKGRKSRVTEHEEEKQGRQGAGKGW